MDILIGKLTYPQSAPDAEIFKCALYSGEKENKLVFNVINRSEVAVTAFHADVVYYDKDQEKKVSVEKRDYYLEPNGVSEEFSVILPKGVEEGRIALPVVLYDNLTASNSYVNVPFASQEVVEKFALDYLSGAVAPAPSARKTMQTQPPVSPAPTRVATQAPVKEQKKEKLVKENNVGDEELKKKKNKQILSLVFMGITLIFAIVCVPWLRNVMDSYEQFWGLVGYREDNSAFAFVFCTLVAITCAFVSALERKGFDNFRWMITTVNSIAGALFCGALIYCLAFFSSWYIIILVFVYPVIPAVIARIINRDAVPTVLLINAFGSSWLIFMNVMADTNAAPLFFAMVQTVVLLVTGVLIKGKNKPRLKSSIVFSLLAAIQFSISLFLFVYMWELSMAYLEYLVFSLMFLIPFTVGLIVGIVRKDRFAWILMLCLSLIVLMLPIFPLVGLRF